MNYLAFIAGSYAIGVVVPAVFAAAAFLRMGAARRKLATIDPRAGRAGAAPRAQGANRSGS